MYLEIEVAVLKDLISKVPESHLCIQNTALWNSGKWSRIEENKVRG